MVTNYVTLQHSNVTPILNRNIYKQNIHARNELTNINVLTKKNMAGLKLNDSKNYGAQQQTQNETYSSCLSNNLHHSSADQYNSDLNSDDVCLLNRISNSNKSLLRAPEPLLSPQSSDGCSIISEIQGHQKHHYSNSSVGNSNNSDSSSSSSSRIYQQGDDLLSPNITSTTSDRNSFEVNQQMSKQQHKEPFTHRKQREFIPDSKKDESYWDRRRRNNEAAKRSREKRRYNDMVLEQRVVELTKENHVLKAQLDAIKGKYNISGEHLVSIDQIMTSLPTSDQVLSITKRSKFDVSSTNGGGYFEETVPYNSIKEVKSLYCSNSQQISPLTITDKQYLSEYNSNRPTFLDFANVAQTNAMQSYHDSVLTKTKKYYSNITSVDCKCDNKSCFPSLMQRDAEALDTVSTHEISINQSQFPANEKYSEYTPNGSKSVNNLQLRVYQNENISSKKNFRFCKASSAHSRNNTKSAESVSFEISAGDSCRRDCNSTDVVILPNQVTSTSSTPKTLTEYVKKNHNFDSQPLHNSNTPNMLSISNGVASEVLAVDVLNLSRRADGEPSAYNLTLFSTSSSLGSAIDSLNEPDTKKSKGDVTSEINQNALSDADNVHLNTTQPNPNRNSGGELSINVDVNNSLPLKLRHKSHLGDKDAANALLSLQHVKQEPINVRLSPAIIWPEISVDNYSDERDSGISAESSYDWPSAFRVQMEASGIDIDNTSLSIKHEKLLKTHLVRLENEVASIKNLMIMNSGHATVKISGTTATATVL